jgi:ABC-2 type transport system permease protein
MDSIFEQKERGKVLEANIQSSSSVFHGFGALVARQVKDWYKSPLLFLLTLLQPAIWIVLYGESFPATNIPGIASNYFSFLSVGMLAFVVLFASVYSGMAIVFDRQSGFLRKMVVTSVSRGSMIMSYVISNLLKALVQAAILIVVAIILGMQVSSFTATGLGEAFVAEALLAVGLSAFFTMIGVFSADPNIQLAVMSFISLPLLFASNSLFPTNSMPTWLRYVVMLNPLSYANDAARQTLLCSVGMVNLALDFLFLTVFAVVLCSAGVIFSLKFLSK